jgi:4-hydroxybutyrate dehydrogenase
MEEKTMFPLLKFPKVQFDFGAIETLPSELSELGVNRPLFVTDHGVVKCGVFSVVHQAMPQDAEFAVFDQTPENPTVEGVQRALSAYQGGACDGIVAVGGGSVIDTAKAVSLLAGHPGSLSAYHDHPEKITSNVAPLIAVPTTAGTGSEASRGAGIHPNSSTRSAGVSSVHLVPKVAICDPNLTLSLPPRLTAGTGMDALSHCVEGFLAKSVNPVLDAVALDGIQRTLAYLERAVSNGRDREARWHMMMAALEGGMSITKGLGPAHALGNTLGDRGFHHGNLVTMALPSVLRLFEKHVPEKTERLARALGFPSGRAAADAIQAFNKRLGLPGSLRELGYPDGDLDEMADDAAKSFFNATTPYHPTPADYKMMIQEMKT